MSLGPNLGPLIMNLTSSKVVLTFIMNFATVTALIDEKYNHPLTPFIVGMTVCQVR